MRNAHLFDRTRPNPASSARGLRPAALRRGAGPAWSRILAPALDWGTLLERQQAIYDELRAEQAVLAFAAPRPDPAEDLPPVEELTRELAGWTWHLPRAGRSA